MSTEDLKPSLESRVTIFRDAVPAVAGVEVVDRGRDGFFLGRYAVHKMMRVGERTRRTLTNYAQRPAAVRYAQKFLGERAAKAGTTYTPGAGAGTMLFKPVGVEGQP